MKCTTVIWWRCAFLIIGFFPFASIAHAVPLVVETWSDAGTAGWIGVGTLFADNPGAGGNPGGWLRAGRGSNPQFSWDASGSGGAFNGNYGTLYGTQLTLSFDVVVQDGGISDIRLNLANSAGSTYWRYTWDFSSDPLVVADGWTSVSAPIDTTWTDAQATANGWVLSFGAGSWASVLANVGKDSYLATITQGANVPPPVGSSFVTGIDNYALSAVPEPTGIVLAGLAAAMCFVSRMRQHGTT